MLPRSKRASFSPAESMGGAGGGGGGIAYDLLNPLSGAILNNDAAFRAYPGGSEVAGFRFREKRAIKMASLPQRYFNPPPDLTIKKPHQEEGSGSSSSKGMLFMLDLLLANYLQQTLLSQSKSAKG